MLHLEDFNTVRDDYDIQWVKYQELCKMIECGAIIIDREKLEEYKRETRVRNLDRKNLF